MGNCDKCGAEFDEYSAENDFDIEYGCSGFSYSSFRRCLCYDCASEVIEDEEDGEYFEECEECGKRFDYFRELSMFRNHVDGIDLTDTWSNKLMCAECALNDRDNW